MVGGMGMQDPMMNGMGMVNPPMYADASVMQPGSQGFMQQDRHSSKRSSNSSLREAQDELKSEIKSLQDA
jgi:hypothetical protein